MKFVDSVEVKGTRISNDGFLIAEAFAVRTGIQLYTGDEVGKPEMKVVRVYRPESEVKSADSLQTFSHAPITIDHPKDDVTASNWKDLAVGEVSTEATWDNNKIKLPLIIKDQRGIDAITSGKRELSAGYRCELVWGTGITDSGEQYDAKQTNIRINHLAIVQYGRAGAECRVGDADVWGSAPIDKEITMTMKTVVFGRDAMQVAADDAGKVEKYLDTLMATHQAALDAKDATIAARDNSIKELEAKVLSDADLDKRVVARAALLSDAAIVAPEVKFDGLSDADVRRAAVVALDKDYADKSAAYIDAMFDIRLKQAKEALKTSDAALTGFIENRQNPTNVADVDFGQAKREQAMLDAWKTA